MLHMGQVEQGLDHRCEATVNGCQCWVISNSNCRQPCRSKQQQHLVSAFQQMKGSEKYDRVCHYSQFIVIENGELIFYLQLFVLL